MSLHRFQIKVKNFLEYLSNPIIEIVKRRKCSTSPPYLIFFILFTKIAFSCATFYWELYAVVKSLLTVPGCFGLTLGVYLICLSRLLGQANSNQIVVEGLIIFGIGNSTMQCYAVKRFSSIIYSALGSVGGY